MSFSLTGVIKSSSIWLRPISPDNPKKLVAPPPPAPVPASTNCKLPAPSVARTCPIVPSSTFSSVTLIELALITAALAVPLNAPPNAGFWVGMSWNVTNPKPFVISICPSVPSVTKSVIVVSLS